MNFHHLCMSCMANKGEGKVCPECGWNEEGKNVNLNQLPSRTILNYRYLIGKPLGSGGFGITYLAWDTILNIKLAVKEYFPRTIVTRTFDNATVSVYEGDSEEEFQFGMEKFLEEARMIARFNENPNIVSVTDFFKENGTAYIVMNYVEGVTLKEYLKSKGGKVSYEEAINLMVPVMDALIEVHKANILHRDVSPDNIYISKSGQVKLLDFGTARNALVGQSVNYTVILKRGYAPPEQYARKGKQGPWTDVYLVAVNLYRLITGIVPPESIEREEEDKLIRPSDMEIEIPEAFEKVLLKGISTSIQDRYETMGEFREAILEACRVKESNKLEVEEESQDLIQEDLVKAEDSVQEELIKPKESIVPIMPEVEMDSEIYLEPEVEVDSEIYVEPEVEVDNEIYLEPIVEDNTVLLGESTLQPTMTVESYNRMNEKKIKEVKENQLINHETYNRGQRDESIESYIDNTKAYMIIASILIFLLCCFLYSLAKGITH